MTKTNLELIAALREEYSDIMLTLMNIDVHETGMGKQTELRNRRDAIEQAFRKMETYPSFAPATGEVFLHSLYAYQEHEKFREQRKLREKSAESDSSS